MTSHFRATKDLHINPTYAKNCNIRIFTPSGFEICAGIRACKCGKPLEVEDENPKEK